MLPACGSLHCTLCPVRSTARRAASLELATWQLQGSFTAQCNTLHQLLCCRVACQDAHQVIRRHWLHADHHLQLCAHGSIDPACSARDRPVVSELSLRRSCAAQIAFMLPTAYPCSYENFNYASVTVGVAVLVVCLAWYFPRYGARHAFRGGVRQVDYIRSGRVSAPLPLIALLDCPSGREAQSTRPHPTGARPLGQDRALRLSFC